MSAERMKSEFPMSLSLRDTGLYDDIGGLGQRIYTSSGQGYEKVRYVRADTADMLAAALRELEEMLDGQEDIDAHGGPNDAMRMLMVIRPALAKAGVA